MLVAACAQMIERLVQSPKEILGSHWATLNENNAGEVRALVASYLPLLIESAVEWQQEENAYSAIIIPYYEGSKIASWKVTVRHPDGTLAHVAIRNEGTNTPLLTFAELEAYLAAFTALSPTVGQRETFAPDLVFEWYGDDVQHEHQYEQARVVPSEMYYGSSYDREKQRRDHGVALMERVVEARAAEFPFVDRHGVFRFSRSILERDERYRRESIWDKAATVAKDAFLQTLDVDICAVMLAGRTNLFDQVSNYNLLWRDHARLAVLMEYPFLGDCVLSTKFRRNREDHRSLQALDRLIAAIETLVKAYGTEGEVRCRYAMFDAAADYFNIPKDPYQHTKTSPEVPFHYFLLERLSGMPPAVGNQYAEQWLGAEVLRLPKRFLAFLYPAEEEGRVPQVGAYMEFVKYCRRLASALPREGMDFHGNAFFYAMLGNPSSAGPVLGDSGKLVNHGGFGGATPNAVGLLTSLRQEHASLFDEVTPIYNPGIKDYIENITSGMLMPYIVCQALLQDPLSLPQRQALKNVTENVGTAFSRVLFRDYSIFEILAHNDRWHAMLEHWTQLRPHTLGLPWEPLGVPTEHAKVVDVPFGMQKLQGVRAPNGLVVVSPSNGDILRHVGRTMYMCTGGDEKVQGCQFGGHHYLLVFHEKDGKLQQLTTVELNEESKNAPYVRVIDEVYKMNAHVMQGDPAYIAVRWYLDEIAKQEGAAVALDRKNMVEARVARKEWYDTHLTPEMQYLYFFGFDSLDAAECQRVASAYATIFLDPFAIARDMVQRITGITPRYKFRGNGDELIVTVNAEVEGEAKVETSLTLGQAKELYPDVAWAGGDKALLGYAAYRLWLEAYATRDPDSLAAQMAEDMKHGLTPLQIIHSDEKLEQSVAEAVQSVIAAGRFSAWENAIKTFLMIHFDPDTGIHAWLTGQDEKPKERLNVRYSLRVWQDGKQCEHDIAGLEANIRAFFGEGCSLEIVSESKNGISGELDIHFTPPVSYPAFKDKVGHFFVARAAESADLSQEQTALVFSDRAQVQVAYHYLVEQGVLPYPERPDNAEISVVKQGEQENFQLHMPSAQLFRLLENGPKAQLEKR